VLVALLAIPAMVPVARADADDTLTIVTGYSVRHEDNLFRLSNGTDPQTTVGKSTKSDTIGTSTLGLRLNKSYSLQRVEFEASLVNYDYRNFDYLDFTARNYAAAWRWQLTPAFQGNLSSTRTETLNSFSDYTEYGIRNIRTDEIHRFDGVLELDGAWRLLGGVAQTVRTNSETFLEEADTRLNSVEAGVRRDFVSGSSVSLIARRGRGEYFNRPNLSSVYQLDNAFEQREQEIGINWPVTAKTTLQGRLAHLEREHEHFSARDYSGPVGSFTFAWRPSEKTALSSTFARELAPYQSDSSSYASTDRVSLNSLWRITGKTSVRGTYGVSHRDYRGAITESSLNDRNDTLRNLKFGLEWQPYRSVVLGASLEKEERNSNQSDYDYKNSTGTVSAQFSF